MYVSLYNTEELYMYVSLYNTEELYMYVSLYNSVIHVYISV
jgi:hypothetical protein